jgi:hypothetical protein
MPKWYGLQGLIIIIIIIYYSTRHTQHLPAAAPAATLLMTVWPASTCHFESKELSHRQGKALSEHSTSHG